MTRDYSVFTEIKALKSDILNCSFSNWYDKFKDHTFKAEIIKPLPSQFLDYLASESIKLPNENKVELEINSDNEYSDWELEEEEEITTNFLEVHETIKQTIAKYKAVAPKMNWSAPKDSTWMMVGNTMKCDNASDVYLLLNALDHITHDLDFPFEDVDETELAANSTAANSTDFSYELVLRKWREINPALEFRVFVRNKQIVGKSQRDLNFYDYLAKLIDENDVNHKINQFISETVIPKFDNNSFVVDVYIPRPFSKVYIIDINPFIRVTDSILYTWTELLNDKEDSIRLITKTNLGRFKTKAYSENQVPLDVIQASQDPNSLAELAKEWQINEKD